MLHHKESQLGAFPVPGGIVHYVCLQQEVSTRQQVFSDEVLVGPHGDTVTHTKRAQDVQDLQREKVIHIRHAGTHLLIRPPCRYPMCTGHPIGTRHASMSLPLLASIVPNKQFELDCNISGQFCLLYDCPSPLNNNDLQVHTNSGFPQHRKASPELIAAS